MVDMRDTTEQLGGAAAGAAQAAGSGPAAASPLGPLGSRQTDCGEFGIHISKDGTWWYRGSPIRRLPLVKLFSTVLRRAEDGSFWLVTPAERGRITVEDAPFIAVELTATGEGQSQILSFRTNLDDIVSADEGHPLRVVTDRVTEEPSPYIVVRDNLEARLTRAVFYELVALGREERVADKTLYGVWSKGTFFPIGSLAAEN